MLSLSSGGVVFLTGSKSMSFTDLANQRHLIASLLKGWRGVYVWTNMLTGRQYVGSSKDLGMRLMAYFSNAYLISQVPRGSLISRALLKYTLAGFTLEVCVLGPSPTAAVPGVQPDYVALEQYYLDTYTLAYNANRNASPAAYTRSNARPNVGTSNPQYGLTADSASAWGREHSDALRAEWSNTRGLLSLNVYSLSTHAFISCFSSGSAFSAWSNTSKPFGTKVAKAVSASPVQAIVFDGHVVSASTVTPAELEQVTRLAPVISRPVSRSHVSNNTPVYGHEVATDQYVAWHSQEACTLALTGRPFVNKKTLSLRLNKGLPYKGYHVQTTPFPGQEPVK